MDGRTELAVTHEKGERRKETNVAAAAAVVMI